MKGSEVCKSTSLWKLHLEADFHTHLPKKASQCRLSCGGGKGNEDSSYVHRLIHRSLPLWYP